ncbi:MAG: phospholipid carrier-dependent glycosyltransferase, partial [Veillonella sp.]|nr:phospholipid carrier-dependent glycosyltransferase [Veillonella sp.]
MINNHMLRIGALFLLTVLCYGFYNAYLPITDPVESNYVLSAITMLKHNSWISPMIYDHVWYDKPPLTYWALMITYKLFGISDFTSRIPNTLVAGASVALMYHIIYRISKSTFASVLCAILLMSTLQFWYISHAIITDGFLFLFTLAIFGYSYLAFTNNDRSAMVKAYIAAALAVITKGPIGIILPGLILLIYICARYAIHRKDESYQLLKDIKLLFNPLGLLTFIAIASPWYIAMYSIHGEQFISGFLGLHNVDRALISEHPKFNV